MLPYARYATLHYAALPCSALLCPTLPCAPRRSPTLPYAPIRSPTLPYATLRYPTLPYATLSYLPYPTQNPYFSGLGFSQGPTQPHTVCRMPMEPTISSFIELILHHCFNKGGTGVRMMSDESSTGTCGLFSGLCASDYFPFPRLAYPILA